MSNQPINTEDDKKDIDEGRVKLLLILAFVVISPITVLVAALVYFLFSYVRIKRSVIAVFSAPVFLLVIIFFSSVIDTFIKSWTETFPKILNQTTPAFEGIILMLGQQMWLATPIGILVGLGFATWRWFTRARWQEWRFRRTPWDIFKYKRTVAKIKEDKDTPSNGMTLGVNEKGERVIQTYSEASAHTLITGGSGSGKTRTAMMRIRDQIKNGDGLVVLDLKNDPEFAMIVKIYCDRYGRKFQHFTLQDITKPYDGPAPEGNAHYDAFVGGDHTRLADMVLDLRDWTGADYYKKMTQSYLQLLFAVLINNPRTDISTLEDAIDLMNPKRLQERARPLASDPRFALYVRSIDALNDEKLSSSVRENLQTNRAQLEIYLQSVAGPWLMLDKKNNNNISLIDTARNGSVVFFSLDSQAYGSLSANLANLIIQDLKTVSSDLLREPAARPFHVFIDEFSAIGSDNIIGLINKARAANMSVTLATQTLGDLVVKDPSLRMQLMGIISSFIIHRANTSDDAEVYAGLTGTTIVNKVRQNVGYSQDLLGGIGAGIGTGNASVEEVEQWRVKPTEIQDLGVGEMFYINSSEHRIEKVTCVIEDINDPKKGGARNEIPTQNTAPETNTAVAVAEPQELASFVDEPKTLVNPFNNPAPAPKVNQQFTPSIPQEFQPPVTLQKDRKMSRKDSNSENPFEEVKNMQKVPLNYNLLRTFFNDQQEVNEQEQQDRADGVVSAPVSQSSAPTAVHRNPAPVAPLKRPGAKLPTRPAFPTRPVKPEKPKGEYDF